jgi:GTP cyclohydrolase II
VVNERREVARGIDALRRGWPVRIGDSLALLAIETADSDRLTTFAPDGCYDVLLSGERAAGLMLGNQRAAADAAPEAGVRLAQTPWLDLDTATALADPARDLSTPFKGPFRTTPIVDDQEATTAALKLARLAGLLPAFFVRDAVGTSDAPAMPATAVMDYDAASHLVIASRARLPIAADAATEIVAFRSAEETVEHVALIIGASNGHPPLVRLHSECLTGDVFGSLKCDCGPQLDAALQRIAEEGWGVLLYLRQEGRGIGLVNKLRAYALQDQGFDTVDANLRLGFAVDARDFGAAARMLHLIGQDHIRLLTNNPAKVVGLQAAGIDVVERVAHRIAANPHNTHYLATKRDRTGHVL